MRFTHTYIKSCICAHLISCTVYLVFHLFPENCSMQKKEKISNDERTPKICETQQNSKIDFGKCK